MGPPERRAECPPLGLQSTARANSNPSRDMFGNPLWLDSDKAIIDATEPHHLGDAVAALDIHLTDDEIRSLEEPYVPRTPTYFA